MKRLAFVETEKNENTITTIDKTTLIKDITRHIMKDDEAYKIYIEIAKQLNEAEKVAHELYTENRTNKKLETNRTKQQKKLEKAQEKYEKNMTKLDEKEALAKQNIELKTITKEEA